MWEAVNPLGTLYNPASIMKAIEIMCDIEYGVKEFKESLFFANGLWNSWWFDSGFSAILKEDCITEFQLRQQQFLETLRKGNTLIVTFGTSIVYFKTENNQPVGTCHKQPASNFYRRRLSVQEIVDSWNQLLGSLQLQFPGLNVIFTVSPVRHLKDGFEGNARSKAILLLALEEIIKENPQCFYFPAFEILNDDLRDYRFYASDFTHPSEEAIEYIWQKFLETFVNPQGLQMLSEGAHTFKAQNHRPKTGALGKPLKEKGCHPEGCNPFS